MTFTSMTEVFKTNRDSPFVSQILDADNAVLFNTLLSMMHVST
jgi:hypothetical protein